MKENILKAEDLTQWMKQNVGVMNDLVNLGIIQIMGEDTHSTNIGKSDYSKHLIQPWHIWQCYNLNPWDADIIKRVLRTKEEEGMSENEARKMDYEKIIHNCKERIRQLDIKERICDKQENTQLRECVESVTKGTTYRCIKDVFLDNGDSAKLFFSKGYDYYAPKDGHLVDNMGRWTNMEKFNIGEYFIKR